MLPSPGQAAGVAGHNEDAIHGGDGLEGTVPRPEPQALEDLGRNGDPQELSKETSQA